MKRQQHVNEPPATPRARRRTASPRPRQRGRALNPFFSEFVAEGFSGGGGIHALWRAVILQAIQDAKSRSSKREMVFHRNQAEHWLFDDRQDFSTVCDLAGYEPDSIRRKCREAKERGFLWRAGQPQKTREEKAQEQLAFRVKDFWRLDPRPPKPRATRRQMVAQFVQLQLAL
jgi:hypothetical protein